MVDASFTSKRSRLRIIALPLTLLGCSGGGAGSVVAPPPTAGTPTPAPVPSPTPSPSPAQTEAASCPTATNAFATFDFLGGRAFPTLATVTVDPATYDARSDMVHVPVSLDRPTPRTIVLRMVTADGTAKAGTDYSMAWPAVIFRPGDPLRQTIAIPIRRFVAGSRFALKLVDVQGAAAATAEVAITAGDTATLAEPLLRCRRASRRFTPLGTLTYSLQRDRFQMSDKGSATAWATSLSYGRERGVNEETGLYVDQSLPEFAALSPTYRWTDDGLVLRSEQFAAPLAYGSGVYRYGASILDGRSMSAVRVQYGQFEWEARLPDRPGSWPAMWLKATTGWPPEIDVFESLNYRDWWKPDQTISSTIHGGTGGVRDFVHGMYVDAGVVYGITGLTTGFHRYAIDIQSDYITWFIDGQEVNQTVNPFGGVSWYPIMNVAVRTTGDYTAGSGDMTVRGFSVYAQ